MSARDEQGLPKGLGVCRNDGLPVLHVCWHGNLFLGGTFKPPLFCLAHPVIAISVDFGIPETGGFCICLKNLNGPGFHGHKTNASSSRWGEYAA